MTLHILSAGAAKGLVGALAAQFERASGHAIEGAFGAVGAMKEKYHAGDPCDLILLSAALVGELEAAGEIVPGSRRDIGRVRTGVAVPAGTPAPAIGDRDALRAALSAASALYIPDPERATAGIHVKKVLERLGIAGDLAGRIRAFPNGATAMASMAGCGDPRAVGVTQVTEILYTPGVALVGPLPAEFELATVYSAAVTRRAADPALAARCIELLAGASSSALRRQGGFE